METGLATHAVFNHQSTRQASFKVTATWMTPIPVSPDTVFSSAWLAFTIVIHCRNQHYFILQSNSTHEQIDTDQFFSIAMQFSLSDSIIVAFSVIWTSMKKMCWYLTIFSKTVSQPKQTSEYANAARSPLAIAKLGSVYSGFSRYI